MSYDKRVWLLLIVTEIVGYSIISYACAVAWGDVIHFLMYGYFGIPDYSATNTTLAILGITPGVNLLGLLLAMFMVISILLF